MNDKLKPCPFCGGEARIVQEYSGLGFMTYHITCQTKKECTLRYVRTQRFGSNQEAIEAWNRRVNDKTK